MRASLLFAEVDWTIVISAVGSASVLVIGAIGAQWYRIVSARWAFERQNRTFDAAGERKYRKDTIAEYQQILELKEKDGKDWRDQVHELRNDMTKMSNQLAVCEWDRARLQLALEDQGRALTEAGIIVHYRPAPASPTLTARRDGAPETTVE